MCRGYNEIAAAVGDRILGKKLPVARKRERLWASKLLIAVVIFSPLLDS